MREKVKWKTVLATFAAAMSVQTACGASEMTSDPQFVFLRPETSSFWRTATNSTISLPVKFPEGATSAELTVEAAGYSRTYTDIAEGMYDLELPAADAPEKENVYRLTLLFDDDAGTVRTAKLGLVQGLMPDAEGATRCIAPQDGAKWNRTRSRAVLPVPYGMTSLSVAVNGSETVDAAELDGAQGWYAVSGLKTGDKVSVAMTADGEDRSALLTVRNPNFSVIIK